MDSLSNRTIHVSGFKKGVDRDQLADHFMRYGGVLEVTLQKDDTYAVIEFHDGRCIPPILSHQHYIGEDKLIVTSSSCTETLFKTTSKRKRSKKSKTKRPRKKPKTSSDQVHEDSSEGKLTGEIKT